MMYFLYGVASLVVLGLICYTTFKAMGAAFDYGNPLWIAAAFVLWAAVIGFMINAYDSEENKGPCLRYETSMYYNAGTKTMMPARRCAERAEWVQQ